MKPSMKILAVIAALILVTMLFMTMFGCGMKSNQWTGSDGASSSGRYRVIGGPATFTIGGTMYTPGLAITIEEGGVALFGPNMPGPEILGWIIDQGSDPGDDGENEGPDADAPSPPEEPAVP